MTFTYEVTDAGDANVRKQIVAPLIRFNESQAGPIDARPLAVVVTDGDGAVVGGLWGSTAYGWLHVDLLVVPEAARGQGAGTRIMDLAEAEAVARGCLVRGSTRSTSRHGRSTRNAAMSASASCRIIRSDTRAFS